MPIMLMPERPHTINEKGNEVERDGRTRQPPFGTKTSQVFLGSWVMYMPPRPTLFRPLLHTGCSRAREQRTARY